MFTYDLKRYWTGYRRLNAALEYLAGIDGEMGRFARAAAVQVLRGGTRPVGLAKDIEDLLTEVSAGLDGAERALLGSPSEGANVGRARDAETDRAGLKELVESFITRHGGAAG